MTLVEQVITLARKNGSLTPPERALLGSLLDQGKSPEQAKTMRPFNLNTGSTPQMRRFLYETCGFPPHYIKEGGKNTTRLATNVDALLSILRSHPGDRRLELCLLLSDRLTQLETLRCKLDPDGRIRYSANIAGTETQRHACHKSNTGSGYNLHTVTAAHKHLFLADPGYEIFNIDLSGADGWTIACEAKALGDDTMYEDLKAGLKPAQAVALLYQHSSALNRENREALIARWKSEERPSWLYPAAKKSIWGRCLTAGHEVLTPSGWVKLEELNDGVPIVCWDAHGNFNYDAPSRIIHLKHTGTLHHFVGNSFDLEATGDHRMPYVTNGNLKTGTADSIADMKSGDLPLSGYWMGGTLREDRADLIAAIQSDGHYTINKKLTFTFRKMRKVQRMRWLLARHEIHYKESVYWSKRDKKNEYKFYCYDAPVFPKQAGWWMLQWNWESLHAYTEEYCHWDGSHGRANCRVAFAKDKEHLMWLGVFRRLAGGGFCYQGAKRSGKGSLIHNLTLNSRSFASRESVAVRSRHVANLPVHCVTVGSGFFLVRHNDKIMITGNCYGMGEQKCITVLAKESYQETGVPVYVTFPDMKALFASIDARYPGIARRQQRINMLLARDRGLECANGSRREFLGDPESHETQKEGYGHHPQVMTTYTTSLAWRRMWYDPENRDAAGEPVVQPLLLTHDSIMGQWPAERREWAIAKAREWFDNEVTIAGTAVRIPFSGAYGANWAEAAGVEGHKPAGKL